MILDRSYALRSDSDHLTNIANWRSILTLTVFFLSSKSRRVDRCVFGASLIEPPASDIIVIFPFRIPLPKVVNSASHDVLVKFRVLPRTSEPLRRSYLPVNFLTGPVFAVLLLLATRAINGVVLRHGILGANGVQPLDIMALFISLVRGPYIWRAHLMVLNENGRLICPFPWMRLACSVFSPSGLQGKVELRGEGYTFISTYSFWCVLPLSET